MVEISTRGLATVLLNRPDRGNAFNLTMLNELAQAFADLAMDEKTRVIALRGSGRNFCAGADLSSRRDEATSGPRHDIGDVMATLDRITKPTIAVVHGGSIGGGAAFAACCDIVLVSASGFFSIPEVRIGIPPLGLAPFFIRAMGYRNFRRYGLSGERIPAGEALRIGLAHQVCEDPAIEQTLEGIVDAFLHGAPGALRELKSAIEQYAVPSLTTILAARSPEKRNVMRSAEAIEGIASFREKRKPRWYPQ
jgi:methylglutaconyl-CoA hydratase